MDYFLFGLLIGLGVGVMLMCIFFHEYVSDEDMRKRILEAISISSPTSREEIWYTIGLEVSDKGRFDAALKDLIEHKQIFLISYSRKQQMYEKKFP